MGGEIGGGGEKIMGEGGVWEERGVRDLRPPDMDRGVCEDYFDIIFIGVCIYI
jgi:hypothetical protein